MNNMTYALRSLKVAAAIAAAFVMSACAVVDYRCPLEPGEDVESPTACLGMDDAYQAAKRGSGGRTSVFLDDQGQLTERAADGAPAPLGQAPAPLAGYYPPSGQPVFQPPRLFQVWSESFLDAQGALHDGHHAWFTTPGRWTRGTMDAPGVVGQHVMRPVNPNELPKGRIVATDRNGKVVNAGGQAPRASGAQTQKDADSAALKTLSQAAGSSATSAAAAKLGALSPQPKSASAPPAASPGVTAPAVLLAD